MNIALKVTIIIELTKPQPNIEKCKEKCSNCLVVIKKNTGTIQRCSIGKAHKIQTAPRQKHFSI